MLNRRVVANIVIFGIIGVILAAWAATNVLSIDAITDPYAIEAQFASSPGLRTHFEVAYLGVKVGSIDSVTLGKGTAIVRMKIEHGKQLPVGVQAAALRQSPVGEPYVELSPPDGYHGGGPFVRRGYVIPTKDTSAPLSYQAVFDALNRLIQSVPPDAVHTLVHELALALDGRADSIRSLVENADSLTSTLAAHADQISQLVSDLTQVSKTLADHASAIGSSVDNLAAVTGALAESRRSIDTIITTGPDFAHQLATILDQSDTNLGCLLDGLGVASSVLDQPASLDALAKVLGYAPQELALLPKASHTAAPGTYLYGTIRLTGPGSVPTYDKTKTLPPVPAVPACGAGATPPGPAGGANVSGGGTATPGAHGTTVTTVPVGHAPSHTATSSLKHVSDKKLPFGWPLVAGVLLVALALSRPWRLIRRGP